MAVVASSLATNNYTTSTCSQLLRLRLGFKCRIRIAPNHSRGRLLLLSPGNVETVLPKLGGSSNSWITCSATSAAAGAQPYSGWVDDGDDDEDDDKSTGGSPGIVVAALGALILVAGLAFASLYISKRNTSKPKPDTEALTVQQEMLLSSDDHNDKVEQVKNDDITAVPDEEIPQSELNSESTTGTHKDFSSSSDTTEAFYEREPSDNMSGGTSFDQNESDSIHTDTSNNTSSKNGLLVTPEFPDMSLPFDANRRLQEITEADSGNGLVDASVLTDLEIVSDVGISESSTEPKDNVLDSPPFSDVGSTILNPDIQKELPILKGIENSDVASDLSSSSVLIPSEPLASGNSVNSEYSGLPSSSTESENILETVTPLSYKDDNDLSKTVKAPKEVISTSLEGLNINENGHSETTTQSQFSDSYINEPYTSTEIDGSNSYVQPLVPDSVSSAGIPAPSLVSAALQVPPGKVVVPAVIDQVQGQALAALQVLKVIEADVRPSDLCTRREYARWLVSASSALSRSSASKVYPAMYIENITELAFDDITPEDPDFAFIQGLAEAGLISSKLSLSDMFQSSEGEQDPLFFFPESPLSRQDLVSWKMALEKRQLPEVDKKIVYQSCGFIDIDKINRDAWPALVADQSAGEQGIMTLAFGYTRLFQPYKPVTKGQAAIALSTGEAADIVSEELARIEAESMAEAAVETHTALVAQVEKDINASFEKELTMEREKIDAIEKMAEEARLELERLRAEREEENLSLMRGRTAVESEMQVLSSLRREVEEQLQSLMSDKMEASYEWERINKLRKEAEHDNQAITQLQYELEVERKALSMARAWAEDEAKRAREQAKALEEARDRWEKHGIKVVVDDDLREDANAGVTWLSAGKESPVEATVSRAESLVLKLKALAEKIKGKSRVVIETIIFKITSLISKLKEWAANSGRQARELQGAVVSKASASVEGLQQSATSLSLSVKEGAKRVAEDCKDGVGKITHKFKA